MVEVVSVPFSPDIKNPLPHFLNEKVYRPGQITGQEDTIIIPQVEAEGVQTAISIGPGSKNMAEMFERDNIDGVLAREESFLQRAGMAPLEDCFLMLPPKKGDPLIADITAEMISAAKNRPTLREDVESIVRAECLYTTEPGVPLLVKPADCPSAIIHAISADGRLVLGVAHLGRPQVNEGVVEQMVEHLVTVYECKLTDITIGLTPGIGPSHYTIREQDQKEKNLLDEASWGKNITSRPLDDGSNVLEVDVLGSILDRLVAKNVPAENIQAYSHAEAVDTYELAKKNPPEAYSNRYANETNQPEKNGRILVAAQLPARKQIPQ